MCTLAPPPCKELTTEPSTWQLRCGSQGAFVPAELDVLPLLQDRAQDQSCMTVGTELYLGQDNSHPAPLQILQHLPAACLNGLGSETSERLAFFGQVPLP